jgi:hypothetical protein
VSLDIIAISRAHFIGPRIDDNIGDNYYVFAVRGFESRLDGYPKGIYESCGEQFDFPAGSYQHYNVWRELLSKTFLGVEPREIWNDESGKYAECPFVELINFPDNEGTIGPKTSAKLAKDFDIHVGIAREIFDQYAFTLYEDWRKAFHLAADTGFVIFH